MRTRFVVVAEWRKLALAGAAAGVGVAATKIAGPQVVGDRTLRFLFSDGSVDREGDSINPDGWDLRSFAKNPVALWAHDSSSPPIGRASNVRTRLGKLVGDIEFMPAEISPFADSVFRMVEAGYIKAVSVGFLPIEWRYADDKRRGGGIDFQKQELLEISLCPVPCNPNALSEARGKGIDVGPVRQWAQRLLRQQPKAQSPSAEAQRIRAEATLIRFGYSPRHAEILADVGIRGKCGREADAPCGMRDKRQCAGHRWQA